MKHPQRIGFIVVFGCVLSMYLWTAPPTVSFWDCGEYIATAYILGVPHPPGSPLQVLVRKVFMFLPIGSEIAFRSNFFSLLVSTLTAAFVYLSIFEIISRFKRSKTTLEKVMTHASGAMGAAVSSFSFTVWHNSGESESYAPATFLLVFSLWLALTWAKNRRRRLLLIIVYIFGLSVGIHLTPLLAAPGVLVLVLLVRADVFRDLKFVLIAVLLFFIGMTTYGYLVIRARQYPSINEASPTDAQKLWDVVTRKQYGPTKILPRQTQSETGMDVVPAFAEQVTMYFKYLSWQWGPHPREEAVGDGSSVSTSNIYRVSFPLLLFLSFVGMFSCYRFNRRAFLLLVITLFFCSIGLVGYMNFKFSPSDPNSEHQPREVRERHYFFAPSFVLLAVFIGLAVYGCWDSLGRFRPIAYVILPFAAAPLIGNYHSHANRRGNYIADDFGHNMLRSCEGRSVLFTNGDNDTFPLWFSQEVKKTNPDVTVCNFSLLNTPWYQKQMKQKGVPMYLTDFQMDNLIAYPIVKDGKPMDGTLLMKDIALRDILAANAGKTFEAQLLLPVRRSTLPKRYRAAFTDELIHPNTYRQLLPRQYWLRLPPEYFLPHKEFANLVMNDYDGELGVYFAVTCSRENLRGLEPYLRMEALVKRLLPDRGDEEFDVERSDSLLNKVYRYRSIFDPSVYKDVNAKRLVSNYVAAYFYLGLAHKRNGDLARAIKALEAADRFGRDRLLPVEYWLSYLYTENGDLDKAEARLLKAVSSNPSIPLWYMLGKIYIAQSKDDQAESSFREAIKLDKNEPSGYGGLLQLYGGPENEQRRIALLDSVLQDAKFVSKLVYQLKSEEREDLAQLTLERWVAAHPYDTSALNLLKQ